MSDSEIIVGVSIISKGVRYDLPKPHRHHHCVYLAYLKEKNQVVTESQGFYTSTGRYVDRMEGMRIAKANNQLIRTPTKPYELFSEDIWSETILFDPTVPLL